MQWVVTIIKAQNQEKIPLHYIKDIFHSLWVLNTEIVQVLKSLPEPLLTKMSHAILSHKATLISLIAA